MKFKFVGKKEREKLDDSILVPILFLLGVRYIKYWLIWLTQLFPFSLLSHVTWITFENREVFQSSCAVRDTGFMTGTFFKVKEFYKDENFIYFEGAFGKEAKQKGTKKFIKCLEKIYGEGNIYFRNLDDHDLLTIAREAALKRAYYSFISEK